MLTLVHYPNPILTNPTKPVDFSNPLDLHTLIDQMHQTLIGEQALGLAANQVNVNQQIFVMSPIIDKNTTPLTHMPQSSQFQQITHEKTQHLALTDESLDLAWYDWIQKPLLSFINPKILHAFSPPICEPFTEGCLSFPNLRLEIQRSESILLQWQLPDQRFVYGWFTKLAAICIQHEIDHLNGRTFLEYLKPLRRQLTLKKYLKAKKLK